MAVHKIVASHLENEEFVRQLDRQVSPSCVCRKFPNQIPTSVSTCSYLKLARHRLDTIEVEICVFAWEAYTYLYIHLVAWKANNCVKFIHE